MKFLLNRPSNLTYNNIRNFAWPISLSLLFIFIVYLAIFAFANPLCCADDASIAVVSKNLALGLGYLQTVNYWGSGADYLGQLFDPGISTGAPSVLSVALGIYLFGVNSAVPGLVHVVIYAFLLTVFAFRIKAVVGKNTAGYMLTVYILLLIASSAYHFEQWYAQLGESLAILLVILGITILLSCASGFVMYFFVGALLGLAILTKQLVAIYVVALFLSLFIELAYRNQLNIVRELKLYSIFLFGLTTPLICFELWKLSKLGLDGWIANLMQFIEFSRQVGISEHQDQGLRELFLERMETINQRFFWSVYEILAVLILYPFIFFTLPAPLRRFSLILFLGLLIHFIYWAFFSIGRPRYFFMGIVVLSLLASISVAVQRKAISSILMLAVLFNVVITGVEKMNWRSPFDIRGKESFSDDQLIAAYIELKHPTEKVFTQWWAHIPSLEYLSSMPGRYSLWNEPRYRSISSRLLISNSNFFQKEDTVLVDLLTKSCNIEISRGKYTLYSCGNRL